ncbi:MAG TPA: hypothetical protein VNO22_13665 [Planctomycetota bacterium]|nr:hypothetical protein [Planctomycetota bacterium]
MGETAASSTLASIRLLADDDLLHLLATEEDRLPRSVAEEILRRGEDLTDALARLCTDPDLWGTEGPGAWAPVHAAILLGARPTSRALPALLAALREAARRRIAWLLEALPCAFGELGRPGVVPLKVRALDRTTSDLERDLALRALAAVAARTPIEQGEILDFFRSLTEDEEETDGVRSRAAAELLRFRRPGDRTVLLAAAYRQAWAEGPALLTPQDVESAYRSPAPDLETYRRDLLDVYRPETVETRLRRRREEAEDARWAAGARAGAAWVEELRGRLLRRYEETLSGLDDEARGDAVWVAESMTEYLVRHEGRAPWRWTAETAYAYLMDVLARRLALDAPGRAAAVPDSLLRFARFCRDDGRLADDALAAVERTVEDEREGYLQAIARPAARRAARETLRRLLAEGVDPADPRAAEAWLEGAQH